MAYFGSRDEKDRFLAELRAEIAAQALAGVPFWNCPHRIGRWYNKSNTAPLWLPQDTHELYHDVEMGQGNSELQFFESIEPGTDLTGVQGQWIRRGHANASHILQRELFFGVVHSMPVRKVP